MPFPGPTGWVPREVLAGVQQPGAFSPKVTPELAQQIQSLHDQYAMMGQQPPFDVPQVGSDATQYLTNLYYRDAQLATQLAEGAGIPKEQFLNTVAGVDSAAQDARGSNVFGTIGNLTSVGRGEVSGVGDFLGDAAKLGAIGYATSFLPGGGATTGSGTATVSGSNTAAGIAPAAGGATTYPLATGGAITGSAIPGVTSGTTAAGAATAGIGGAANVLSNVPKWLDYALPAANALTGIYAADRASDAEAAGMDRAIAENARQYDTTRADLMPWLQEGQRSLSNLRDPNAFQASPGYEWARSEGQRDVGNSFAARGGAASGNALRALSEFNTGLAQQDYNNWWNREAGVAGVGQNTAVNLGSIGSASANRAGNYFTNQGAARASGVLGKYGALAGAGQDIYENYLYRRRAA